jgi:parallel beta-helix repeat protein
MRKMVLIWLLLFALLALAFTFKAERVRASPKDIWVPYDYPTIQAAINAADPGDVIHVASGTYGGADIRKPLTLIAEGEVIINGYFWVGQTNNVNIYNFRMQNDFYGVWLYAANSCIIENNYISSDDSGIRFEHAFNNYVFNNTITTHPKGFDLRDSSNNYIIGNTLSTLIGIDFCAGSNNNTIYNNWVNCSYYSLRMSSAAFDNLIFHNNFIGNNSVIFPPPISNNKWFLDWPVGGNFWSSHTSPDVKSGQHQNEPGSDGICDNYYTIAEGVIDAYPLMGPCNRFEVQFGPLPSKQEISVISNSSISNFQMNTTQKTISFNVAGESGTGFCRVDVPNVIVSGLWQNNYKVLVNGQEPLYIRNWTSGATTYIYFQYQHSTKEVVIVPEFQSALIPTLLILSTIIISTKKLSHRKTNPFIFPFHPHKHKSSC